MKQRMYEFTTGVETSTQPDAGTPSAANDLVTKGWAESQFIQGKADNEPLVSTDTSKIVTFATPFPALTEFEVFAIIKDTTKTAIDQNKFPINITAQSVNGFTATWDSEVGSNDAVLSWIAMVKNNA